MASISVATAAKIQVHPNPTTDILTINIGSFTNATIKLYSLQGVLLATKSDVIQNSGTIIDMSNYASGNYIIDIELDGKTTKHPVVKL